VRVQDAAKAEMGVMEYEEARQLAIASDADVILINDSGDPPVVRLIAFGKYKFEIERATKQKQKSSKGCGCLAPHSHSRQLHLGLCAPSRTTTPFAVMHCST
jgi:Translation initiation factor IF-3, N-terminal domain